MDMNKMAEVVAQVAHAGQVDKNGVAYFHHPQHVAAAFFGHDDEAYQVAMLHDVVEDTNVTAPLLEQLGFSPEVVAAVVAISRKSNHEGDAYYARVKANALALRVKVQDLAHNESPERVQMLNEADQVRLAKKYQHAKQMLGLPNEPA
jgi:(p)ppGpp synthase/HD superfamily hydrolase